jgi:hypothetical protein
MCSLGASGTGIADSAFVCPWRAELQADGEVKTSALAPMKFAASFINLGAYTC